MDRGLPVDNLVEAVTFPSRTGWMVMRKTIYMMTAAALVFAAVPAHADAKATDGKVGLSVYGKGLRVDTVGAHIDGHGTGVRARLITYTPRATGPNSPVGRTPPPSAQL